MDSLFCVETVRPWLVEVFNKVKKTGSIPQSELDEAFDLILGSVAGLTREEFLEEMQAGMTVYEFSDMIIC